MKTKTKKAAPAEPGHTTQSPDKPPEIDPSIDLKTTEQHIERITDRLFRVSSANRLPVMLDHLNDHVFEPEICWPVFHAAWSTCDSTWEHGEELSEFLEWFDLEPVHPRDYLTPEDKAAFEKLPKHIRIYRGCRISNVYGFSWTTDRKVAERFARGHRGISVPDPVIASFRIPKKHALGFYTSRGESEVFIDNAILGYYAVTVKKLFMW